MRRTHDDAEVYRRILVRCNQLTGDELRVLDFVAQGLLEGRSDHGTLELRGDRHFPDELAKQLRDSLIALTCYRVLDR